MTRVKICGITNAEDAAVCVEAGANALGFIFVPNTPRYVGDRAAGREIARRLPPFVSKVAVCQHARDAELLPVGYDTVQVYARNPDVGLDNRLQWIQVFPVRDAASLEAVARVGSDVRAILLDTHQSDKLGGSGETFNWELALEARERFLIPLILAGGLTPENVGDAIARVRPYAVDVSSGVELAPGQKDHAKIRAFLHAVQRADALLPR